MNKMKKILCLLFAMLMVAGTFVVTASAGSAYQTYVYDIYGEALYSPDAYVASEYVDWKYMTANVTAEEKGLEGKEAEEFEEELAIPLTEPGDMITDLAGNIYIADTANNRIVVLDPHYKINFFIKGFGNDQGVPDMLTAPQGLYVTEANDKYNTRMIWVCDTGARRIVVFDEYGEFVKIIDEPTSTLFDEDAVYTPVAIAVDAYNRLYVVSSTTYQGIIVMTDNGTFTGFIGAQAVSLSAWEILWRRFQTEEQRKQAELNISTEFNNITINRNMNLVYVTTSTIDPGNVSGFIKGGGTDGTYSPVKLLNANGTEIMRRNGFWPPAGEVDWADGATDAITGVSTIIDAAVGPLNTWSLIDEKRNRVYTYDFNGNLLFAFGDEGTQLGNLGTSGIEAITYQDTNMLLLDKTNNSVTVFKRTEYGDILLQAIEAENSQQFDLAINLWTEVLKRNSNFDSAYVGIGQAMFRNKDYASSLTYFESAYDTGNWSASYKEIRKQWMSDYFLVLILIIVAIIVAVSFFFSWINKLNKRVATSGKKRHFGHEIAYGFYIIFHPFDGFWDLKHEKRGSVRGAIFYIVLAIAAFYYQGIGSGYLIDPFKNGAGVWSQILGVLIPLFLFILANWCLTTLFEGEGSFKDIFIATSYSLVPIPLLIIPATIYSNFCIATEVDLISLLGTIAFVWLGMLIFFGTMVTHDYSMGKNIITVAGTIVAMVFIMFIAILFTTLVTKIVSLITNIVTEIQYRV